MANRLELPDELKALIEKREQQRRQSEKQDAEQEDQAAYNGPERRSGKDRREESDQE